MQDAPGVGTPAVDHDHDPVGYFRGDAPGLYRGGPVYVIDGCHGGLAIHKMDYSQCGRVEKPFDLPPANQGVLLFKSLCDYNVMLCCKAAYAADTILPGLMFPQASTACFFAV